MILLLRTYRDVIFSWTVSPVSSWRITYPRSRNKLSSRSHVFEKNSCAKWQRHLSDKIMTTYNVE
jgi:hypothetical protein